MPELKTTRPKTSSRAATRQTRTPELQADQELSKALIQNSRDGIFAFDHECHLTIWNPALERIFGITAQHALGRSAFEVLPFLKTEGDELRSALEGRTSFISVQSFTISPAGPAGYFEATYAPWQNRTGEIIGGLAIIHDISERIHTEKALREGEAHFRQLAEAIPHMVWTTLPNGQFDYCNGRWCEYTGQTMEQSQGFGWLEAVHPEHLERIQDAWKVSLKSGELYEVEYPLRGRDGSYRWHLDRALPLRDHKGGVIKWFGTCTDVHEKRLTTEIFREMNTVLEKRVDDRTKSLREVNEQMESFCYTVSHDLRAPLRAMRAFTQVLLDDYISQLDSSGQDFLRRVGVAAERMDGLIQDLLQYSRLGRMELTLEPIDVEKVVDDIVVDLRLEARARNAVIKVEKPLGSVVAQETVLQQILLNLISNALKFVAAGVAPEIRVWSETCGDKVRFYVRDNGIGIPEEYYGRIFRVFERLHGVEVYPGTGIGLAIVQKGIDRMNGSVGVTSEMGKGSCFWIELPKSP